MSPRDDDCLVQRDQMPHKSIYNGGIRGVDPNVFRVAPFTEVNDRVWGGKGSKESPAKERPTVGVVATYTFVGAQVRCAWWKELGIMRTGD